MGEEVKYGKDQKLKAIPLPDEPESIRLKNHFIKDLAPKLFVHRNTLSKELQRGNLFEELKLLGYYKGKKLLTPAMVKVICEYFGYEHK